MTTDREIEAGAAALRRHDSAAEGQELPDCPSYREDARIVLEAAAQVRGRRTPCVICGKRRLTGYDLGGAPGSHLIDMTCCDGVWMDIDEYTEGWQPDVIYPPCPNNPNKCKYCDGAGNLPEKKAEKHNQGDCPKCNGGWLGDPQWPMIEELEAAARVRGQRRTKDQRRAFMKRMGVGR